MRIEWRPAPSGILVALFFFSGSLQPSLLPRAGVLQAVVSGIVVAIGYAIGVGAVALYRWLGLRPLGTERTRRIAWWVAVGVATALVVFSMWKHVGWQNDQRELFGMATVTPAVWLVILPGTVAVTLLLIAAGKGVRALVRLVASWMQRVLPRRVIALLGAVVLVTIVLLAVNGALFSVALDSLDSAFSVRDRNTPEGVTQPTSALRSGGSGSVVAWDSMGRQSKSFVAGGPTADQIAMQIGAEASEPIRVYVGLRSAPSAHERAALALSELQRTGAFDRETLVLATTTGTGYVDPAAADTIEMLHAGNTAIAALQ